MTVAVAGIETQAVTPLLHEAVAFHGRFRPDAPALLDASGTTTYRELQFSVTAIARALRRRGLRRIGVLLGNSANHLELLLGAAAADVTVCPMHPGWGKVKLDEVALATGVEAVVSDQHPQSHVAGIETLGFADLLADLESSDGVDSSPLLPPVPPGAWQLLAPTGGTSGSFKAVAISHRASAARALAQVLAFGMSPSSRFVATTPLYHGAARGASFAHLMAGGSVELQETFEPTQFAALMEGATSTFCVPTMLVKLLEVGVGPLPSDFLIVVSGAALDPELAQQAQRQLGCRLVNYYASVDAGGMAAAPVTADVAATDGIDVGFPFLGSTIDLLDESGMPVEDGAEGLVTVRSASLSSAVLSSDGDVRSVGDRLQTGDLGRFDEQGRVLLLGRADDVIITGGVNVSPEDVESQLRRHPAVQGVLVTGIDDSTWGQTVGCLLVLEGGKLGEVEHWAATRLATAERPRRFRVVPSIPLTPLGKPDRHAAATMLKEDA